MAELSGIRVIVTDAATRLGLYVIRALGRAGCRVTALTRNRTGPVIGFSSRYASERHRLPAGSYAEVLPDAIDALAAHHDVLVPVSTFSISVVGSEASRLAPQIQFYIPPLESFRLAASKRETTRVAREAGVPVPATFDRLDPRKISTWVAGSEVKLPLVVKFADDRRSGAWNPADRYSIVATASEFAVEYRRMHRLSRYPVVQEYIDGEGYGFSTIFGPEGEAVVGFCHRRLREYPISGGPSTLCESVHDERLVELGTRLLRKLEWRGVAMVEFKRERATGEYKLLEINPRFWGSMPLALHCGLNFPAYQVQLALGLKPSAPGHYPTSRKMRFLFSDLLAARDEWRAAGRRRVPAAYLKELLDFSIKDGLFDLDDPRPVFTYVRKNLRR